MKTAHISISRLLMATLISVTLILVASAQGQTLKQSSEPEQEDVIRINTELVQTDVAVFDKQGRFVEGLQPEQFELRVGGQPKEISFFDRVKAGSPEEERQLTAGRRGGSNASQAKGGASVNPQYRGRMIFFFVDDVHLSAENLARARQALLRFVDNEMGQDDQVAVVSASGQIGFLQQLTNNKAVLREAITRLVYKRNPDVNADSVISEYDANQVEARNRELFRYLVGAMVRLGSTNPAGAVLQRSRLTSAAARHDTVTTLTMLEALIRSSAPLPGRKTVFFISDGFVTDARRSGVLDSLRQITNAAAQVGAVIYTMDARGTFADSSTDASKNPYPDFTGSVSRNIFAEAAATQEPLRNLAADTGGQAILNSNSFEDGFRRALNDSSDYYLLAWRPEYEEYPGEKARIKVSIKGRPDLKVRVRRGFIESPAVLTTKKKQAGKPLAPGESRERELLVALGSIYPLRTLPLALSVGYMSTPDKGTVLAASMQIDAAALKDSATSETQKAEIDVLGVALNDRGSINSFKQTLSVPVASVMEKQQQTIAWNQQLPLSPGLYQVRVAVRDRQSGQTGSAMQWIEIPRITAEDFSMSSIFIGERKTDDSAATPNVPVSVTRRFSRSSRLRYQIYFYNVSHKVNTSEIVIRVQVLHNGQPVMPLPQIKLASNGGTSLTRPSYSGEIALEQLRAGRYLLQISASDQESKKSISQQTDFIID